MVRNIQGKILPQKEKKEYIYIYICIKAKRDKVEIRGLEEIMTDKYRAYHFFKEKEKVSYHTKHVCVI